MSRRNFNSGSSFLSRSYAQEEDADPRVGLVNLADVMLVFACGLMLALASYWGLDVASVVEVSKDDTMIEIDDASVLDEQQGGEAYVDVGRVYQDPETGKLYILEE